MKRENEHLSDEQLGGYYARAFSPDERLEIGRHLLGCDICLARLPAPTLEQMRGIVAGAPRERVVGRRDARPAVVSLAAAARKFRIGYGGLALKAAALVLLAAVSYLLLVGMRGLDGEDLAVARSFEDGPIEVEKIPPSKLEWQEKNVAVALPPFKENDTLVNSGKHPKNRERPPEKARTAQKAKEPSPRALIVSSTRGGGGGCSETEDLAAREAIGPQKEITLRWKKVPRAVNYHLYVSDDDEILVAEFETASETVYALKAPLQTGKTYHWKIAVTLENGETIYSDARKFRISGEMRIVPVAGRRRDAQVRCAKTSVDRK